MAIRDRICMNIFRLINNYNYILILFSANKHRKHRISLDINLYTIRGSIKTIGSKHRISQFH